MRAFVLLVGLVVLFIDDDQPEIGVRQKQRRARADHDLRLAGRDRRPVARAGARRQFGMPFQRPHAETLREAVEKLPGQRDLRHQDQRLPAAADDFGDRLEIDLGLARAGDAVEQRDVKAAVRGQRAHGIDRGALLAGKFRLRRMTDRAPAAAAPRGIGSVASVPSSTRPSMTPALTPASLRGLRFAVQQSVRQNLDQPPPRRRQRASAARRPAARPVRIRSGPRCSPIRKRHAQHHAARRQRVIGDPVDQRCAVPRFSGGTSSFSLTSLRRLCSRGSGLAFSAHTTAITSRGPSGTPTTSPGFSSMPRGTR